MAVLECRFLVPVTADGELGDGEKHSYQKFNRFHDELIVKFGFYTRSSGEQVGCYTDPDTGNVVTDNSVEYRLALDEEKIPALRTWLSEVVAPLFVQKIIYFHNGKTVEFLKNTKQY